jgi:hypothetical protein
MSNYILREAATNNFGLGGYYAKNFSLAWINWELNRQEEQLLKPIKLGVRYSHREIRGGK